MNHQDLKDHIFTTYINLRVGIAFISGLFPIILIGVGYFSYDIKIQNSLSAYYHASPEMEVVPKKIMALYDKNPNDKELKQFVDSYSYRVFHTNPKGQFLRSFFVSLLIAIGAFLYLYKGYSVAENIALNLAGIFAIGVALFPMTWENGAEVPIFQSIEFGEYISLHGICAILLVLSVAYVCVFRPSKTLNHVTDETQKRRFKTEYNILGALMVVLPIVIFIIGILGNDEKVILWIEIAVLFVFARFWLTKSREIKLINSDQLVAEGKFITDSKV